MTSVSAHTSEQTVDVRAHLSARVTEMLLQPGRWWLWRSAGPWQARHVVEVLGMPAAPGFPLSLTLLGLREAPCTVPPCRE